MSRNAMFPKQRLLLCWSDCFVLLNVANYLNGEDIHSLKSSITDSNSLYDERLLDEKFDDIVKQLVLQRLHKFDKNKNIELFEMAIYFIKQRNKDKYIQECNNYYWIYDMIGAKEPALSLIDSSIYNNMGNTEWRRDDHRTFLTTEIFLSGNLFLIINILKFVKINNYSLTNCRYGSSVNQIDKILLKLVLSFGKSLKMTISKDEESTFIVYNTKFLEFAYFYLHEYVPYVRHKQFLHKLLNREIHRGNIECVKMLRNKCKAPMVINSDPNIIFQGEQKLFDTFRNAQYCMTIWSLMILHLHFDIKLILCLKACYDIDEIDENELLDMDTLQKIVNYFMKPIPSDQYMKYHKNEEILKFWQFIKRKNNVLKTKQCANFVNQQIDLHQQ